MPLIFPGAVRGLTGRGHFIFRLLSISQVLLFLLASVQNLDTPVAAASVSRHRNITLLDHELVLSAGVWENISAIRIDCVGELFKRYGNEQGKITFESFGELLGNIGLGDITPDDHLGEDDHDDDHHDDDHDEVDLTTTDEFPVALDDYLGEVGKAGDDKFHQVNGDTHSDPHVDSHVENSIHTEKCMSAGELLHVYGFHPWEGLDEHQFLQICPVLVQQLDSHSCHQEDTHGEDHHNMKNPSLFSVAPHVWGYGFLAITIISGVSLMGIMVVPVTRHYPKLYRRVISFLVALAVGSLSGDALLHLIPHSFSDTHSGEASHGGSSSSHPTHSLEPVYKGLVVLLGIYFFFITERIMNLVNYRKKQNRTVHRYKKKCRLLSRQNQILVGAKLYCHDERYNSSEQVRMITMQTASGDTVSFIQHKDHTHAISQEAEKNPLDHNNHHHDDHDYDSEDDDDTSQEHHGHSHDHGDLSEQSVASVAWMVIMGDGLHNFSDGLAIGAAFAGNTTAGLSTTIAVFCHELPHELGDFAILLSAGMSVRRAIMYSLVSSVLAYMGMCIGIALGNIESMSSFLFALAGGMFLYIALVDMLPEMASAASAKNENQCCHLILQNLGVSTGIAIMLLIALFEEDLLAALE